MNDSNFGGRFSDNNRSTQGVYFSLPNGKVGEPYRSKIVAECSEPIVFQEVVANDESLCFNKLGQTIEGVPSVADEREIQFRWKRREEANWYNGTVRLIITPDPRSLWKVLEPSEEIPFAKEHLSHSQRQGVGFTVDAASRRGRSHEHSGQFRDDDFFIDIASDWSIMIVADGAGSAPFSREGSRIAAYTAGEIIKEKLCSDKFSEINQLLDSYEPSRSRIKALVTEIFYSAVQESVASITETAASRNHIFKDYSTTFLATMVKKCETSTFVASFWIGDGVIAAIGPDREVQLMGTPDYGEFAGQTRFLDQSILTSSDFASRVCCAEIESLRSVVIMSDGVSDPLFETEDQLSDGFQWEKIWNTQLAPLLQKTDSSEQILHWLHFFIPGYHDDRTIAIWYHTERSTSGVNEL